MIETRIDWLRKEVKRILEHTLRRNFANPDDRLYWEKRVKTLNGELMALEEAQKPKRPPRSVGISKTETTTEAAKKGGV